MVVFTTECAPLPLRGELTRWMLEVKPGVFVGNISAMVRLILWRKITESSLNGALMIYSTNNEQGFSIEMFGEPRRSVIDLDGIQLIKT